MAIVSLVQVCTLFFRGLDDRQIGGASNGTDHLLRLHYVLEMSEKPLRRCGGAYYLCPKTSVTNPFISNIVTK
jgi:hypothetical protein